MMLVDTQSRVIISSLGWVDQGGLWSLRVADGSESRISLGEAKWLSLHPGSEDHFSVVHHFEGDRIEITVHSFREPREALGRAVVAAEGAHVLGDAAVWASVPRSYVAYYAAPPWSDFTLVRVDAAAGEVELQQFDWYGRDYDKGYQGIVGVVEVPGQDLLIVSVQRDSKPVLYDPIARRQLGSLSLAGRGGNPTLFFRRHANELWADDYDTILKLEPNTWRVLGSRRLQSAMTGTGQFIGRFAFNADETLCVIARPYSGDVIALDPRTLRLRFRARTGAQPLEAMALPDRSVVARDWKTGTLLRADLRRAWFV
jgi:hypothetical protein